MSSALDKKLFYAQHLSHSYGAVRAVRDVSLGVSAGEMLAMIGPNGAGKSTVFGLLAGDLPVSKRDTTTTIVLNTTCLTHASVQARCVAGLGRTYQSATPFVTLSVEDNLRVALSTLHLATNQMQSTIDILLTDSGLNSVRHTPVADLPYPDWKKLDLVLALAQSPKVLLLDEPTAGLSAPERAAMMDWVRRLSLERGIAIIFTEHNLDAVFEYATTVMVLDRGSVLAQGTPAEIAANPQVQAAYTGAYRMPNLVKTIQNKTTQGKTTQSKASQGQS